MSAAYQTGLASINHIRQHIGSVRSQADETNLLDDVHAKVASINDAMAELEQAVNDAEAVVDQAWTVVVILSDRMDEVRLQLEDMVRIRATHNKTVDQLCRQLLQSKREREGLNSASDSEDDNLNRAFKHFQLAYELAQANLTMHQIHIEGTKLSAKLKRRTKKAHKQKTRYERLDKHSSDLTQEYESLRESAKDLAGTVGGLSWEEPTELTLEEDREGGEHFEDSGSSY